MPVSKVSSKQWCQERSHVWRQSDQEMPVLQSVALAIRTRTSVTPMLTYRSSPVHCSGTFIGAWPLQRCTSVALATRAVHSCCLGHYASTFPLPWPPVVHFFCPGHWRYISLALTTSGTFLLPWPPVVHFCCLPPDNRKRTVLGSITTWQQREDCMLLKRFCIIFSLWNEMCNMII